MKVQSHILLTLVLSLILCCLPFCGIPPAIAEDISNEDCMGCHSDAELQRESGTPAGSSVFVPADSLKSTPHEEMDCVNCHSDITEVPHAGKLARVNCANCHDEAAEVLSKSIHGITAAAGNTDAPSCTDCHGTHEIRLKSDPASLINPKNVSATCARCHSDPETSKRNHFNIVDPFKTYKESIHYQKLQEGMAAATCSECHSHHLILKSEDPESHTSRKNIATTCGHCHEKVSETYQKSIHGKALAHGVTDSPSCTDCHGEHGMKSKDDPGSTIYPSNITKTTCPRCHDNTKMMSKYGIETSKHVSYENTYHGLALSGGSLVAANCASCHGIHDILPSGDEGSSIHPKHLVVTCGKCHPKANENFVKFKVHTDGKPQNKHDWLVEGVRWIYIVLIILTIGGMLAHNGIIYLHMLWRKWKFRRSGILYTRFSFFEIANHMLLILAFTILVITGFMLKFPNAWWVEILSMLGISEFLRGTIHRTAGVILILQGIAHFFWSIGTVRGRGETWALLPRPADIGDAIGNMLYHLGISKQKPKFARYTYIDKSEYWAMAWGTGLMAVTGLMLWFPAQVTRYLPAWTVELSEVIHYYEAWLATLAILVWHMFFVWFHPDEYPLSFTWLDGKISEDDLKHHHPGEYEEMKAQEEKDKYPDEKPSNPAL